MSDTKPGTFTITRSKTIAAPPETIFPLIDNFHAWVGWSPWENVPNDELIKTFSGAEKSVGSIYEWTGKKTGKGRMEIIGSSPSSRIDIDLQFMKPFKAENLTEFHLTPTAGGTEVVWIMTGKTTLMSKVMGLFMNMDKMLGGSFEQGLAALKAIAER